MHNEELCITSGELCITSGEFCSPLEVCFGKKQRSRADQAAAVASDIPRPSVDSFEPVMLPNVAGKPSPDLSIAGMFY